MKSVLFAVAASAAFATAAPASADADSTVDEVIVTARAGIEAQKKVEASYAITVVGEEKLRLQSPVSVAEALKNVPGLWVEASGGEVGANIRARGIPLEGYSTVALYEDGLPVQHDGGLGFLNTDFSMRLDETVQRMEAVRGGPSSIFASYAPGGVVNFITRKGGDQLEGLVKAQVGDYGLYRGDFWVGGPVAGFRLGLGGFYRVSDGVRDPGYRPDEGGQLRFSIGKDFERGSIDFNVKRIDDKVMFYLPIPVLYDTSGDPQGMPGLDPNFGTLSGPDTARLTFRTNRGPFNFDATRGAQTKLTQYTLGVKYELGDWRLAENLRYRTSDITRAALVPNTAVAATTRASQFSLAGQPAGSTIQFRYANAPNEVFDMAGQNGNGLVIDAAMREQDMSLDEWVNDLRLQRRFEVGGQSHDVAFGVYAAKVEEEFFHIGALALIDVRSNARLLNAVVVGPTGQVISTLTENGITRYGSHMQHAMGESKIFALYASDEWRLTDRLRVDLGLRWEKVTLEGRNENTANLNLGQSPTAADDAVPSLTGVYVPYDREFDGWSGALAFNYEIAPDFAVYGRYTRAFRLPSIGDFLTNPTNTAPRTQGFDLVEGGLKVERDRFSLYATAFYTAFDSQGFSETRYDAATNSFISRTEFASTRAYGVELEGVVRPTEWFDVSFAGTAQDPRVGDFIFNERVAKVAGACPLPGDTPTPAGDCLRQRDFSGAMQIRTPKVSGRITPGVNLLDGRLRAELDIQYYGKRYGDLAQTQILPAYHLINAQVRYNVTDALTLYAYGTNLTNEIGLTEGNPRAGQFISGEGGSRIGTARPELGRAFRAAVLYRF